MSKKKQTYEEFLKEDEELDVLSDFGKKNMTGWQRDSYNVNRQSNVGEYRSREDYEASGGPVDPCADALWLHDQE